MRQTSPLMGNICSPSPRISAPTQSGGSDTAPPPLEAAAAAGAGASRASGIDRFRSGPFTDSRPPSALGGVGPPLRFLQSRGKLSQHAHGDLDVSTNHPVEDGAGDLDDFRVFGRPG